MIKQIKLEALFWNDTTTDEAFQIQSNIIDNQAARLKLNTRDTERTQEIRMRKIDKGFYLCGGCKYPMYHANDQTNLNDTSDGYKFVDALGYIDYSPRDLRTGGLHDVKCLRCNHDVGKMNVTHLEYANFEFFVPKDRVLGHEVQTESKITKMRPIRNPLAAQRKNRARVAHMNKVALDKKIKQKAKNTAQYLRKKAIGDVTRLRQAELKQIEFKKKQREINLKREGRKIKTADGALL